jgi:MoaA/NifB/PqqE/SkfB family radical SAM enzyme
VESDYIDYPYFSGAACHWLGAVLAQAGLSVHVLDAMTLAAAGVRPTTSNRVLLGVPHAALMERLRDARFDVAVVYFSPWRLDAEASPSTQYLLRRLRQLRPESLLVGAELYVGGMHRGNVSTGVILSRYPELDAFVWGEGEKTLLESLVRHEQTALGPTGSFRDALRGEIHGENSPAELLAGGLSFSPWSADAPAEDAGYAAFLERVGATSKAGHYGITRNSRPVFFSRGCPYSCRFCSSPGKNYRALPLSRCVHVLDDAAAREWETLFVLDDAANVRNDFGDLVTEASRRGLKLEFPNGLRADRLTAHDIRLLKPVTSVLTVSAESGSPRVMKEVAGKTVTPEDIERVAGWCRAEELPLRIHWMVGFPGETRQEVFQTLSLARRLLDDYGAVPLVQYMTPWGDATGSVGHRMQHEPTCLPEGVDASELTAAVGLLRQRALDAQGAKVIINLTYRCNNHCRFCAVGNRLKEDLSLDYVTEVLERYRREGVSQLDLDGGEPTLHPGLFEIVVKARQLGFRPITITTNGRRLAYGDFAKRLVTSGVNLVLFSIHGHDAATHEAVTQAPGSYRETMTGLKNLLALRDDGVMVGVNTTLSLSNYRTLDRLAEQMVGLKVPQMNLQFLTPFGRADAEEAPDPEDAASVVRAVVQRWGERIRFQVINLPYCHLRGLERLVAQDLGKLSRTMVFVTGEEVNLYRYLAGTRRKDGSCEGCLFQVACDGRYDFGKVWS